MWWLLAYLIGPTLHLLKKNELKRKEIRLHNKLHNLTELIRN